MQDQGRHFLTFYGLRFTVEPTFLVTTFASWAVFGVLGALFIPADDVNLVLFGLGAMLIFWLSDIVHNLGHALAARSTGYPMAGIRFWLMGTATYPADEPELPPETHIRRALGGPILSFGFSLLCFALGWLLGESGGMVQQWLLFSGWLNGLFFTIAALFPLDVMGMQTDGGTILIQRRAMRARK